MSSYQTTANEDTGGRRGGGSGGRTQKTVDVMCRGWKNREEMRRAKIDIVVRSHKREGMSGLLPRFPFRREVFVKYKCYFLFLFLPRKR